MFDSMWLVLVFLVLGSPALFWWAKNPMFDRRSFVLALGMGGIAACLPLVGFGEPHFVWPVLFAQTLLYTTYVSVSRMRQRKSAFLHAVMSVGSNGGWFLTMFVLATAYTHAQQTLHGSALSLEFAGFLVATIAGILGGRLVGVQWMQWVEKKYGVKTDSVGSPALARLDRYTVPTLLYALLGTVLVLWLFELVPLRDVLVVTVLGFLQNGIYAFNTRLANRNHPGWPVVTGLLGGIVFIVHWTYLLGYSAAGGIMPFALLLPYTVATVAGSNVGALFSMIFEGWFGLNKPDAHVKEGKAYAEVLWHRRLLIATAILCGVYLVWSEPILALVGVIAHDIVLPFSFFDGTAYARMAAMIFGGFVFFANNITHTLSSRAGNRNHAPYHAATCLLHGSVTFSMGAFVILNASFLDLIPIAALGSAAGQLYAQKFSMWMEKRLVSVMDVD